MAGSRGCLKPWFFKVFRDFPGAIPPTHYPHFPDFPPLSPPIFKHKYSPHFFRSSTPFQPPKSHLIQSPYTHPNHLLPNHLSIRPSQFQSSSFRLAKFPKISATSNLQHFSFNKIASYHKTSHLPENNFSKIVWLSKYFLSFLRSSPTKIFYV